MSRHFPRSQHDNRFNQCAILVGDERLESVRIVREGPTRTTWHKNLFPTWHNDLNEELVLEIVVSPTKSKSHRSMAWASVKEACLPFMDLVDWNRSMPYSIQEIRHTLGIEAAYEMVTKVRDFSLLILCEILCSGKSSLSMLS